MTSNSSKAEYRLDIDGLRALALIAVLVNHINKNILINGFLGVDIFFVISGFVITSSLIRWEKTNSIKFFIDFYGRRIKRLLPALLIYVIFMSILVCIVNPAPGETLLTGIFSILGVSNFYLLHRSFDYFSLNANFNVFMHTWSLGVEWQFYLIFPFLIHVSGYLRNAKKNSPKLLVIMTFLSICSLILFIYFYSTNNAIAYFSIATRFWEISIGVITFLIYKHNKINFNKAPNLLPICATLFIIFILFFPLPSLYLSHIAVVFLTGILLISLNKNSIIYKIFSKKNISSIGKSSYSIYLWHWGVISLSYWIIGTNKFSLLFQIPLIFILSLASFSLIENPGRNLLKFKNRILGLYVWNFIFFISLLLIWIIGKPLRKYLYMGRFETIDFRPIFEIDNGDELSKLNRVSDKKVIFITGGSHASHLIGSLRKFSKENGYKKIFFISTNFRELNKLRENDLIIYSRKASLNKNSKKDIRTLIKIATYQNAQLILVNDVPRFGSNQHVDFYPKFTFYGNGPSISREYVESYRREHTEMLKSFVDESRVIYLDPLPYLCEIDICSAVINGKLIYSDGSPHLNRNGILFIENMWSETLQKFLK